MSTGYARQAKRVMSADCLSSVCLNLLDSYPRIKALHFHQNYVAPPHGNGTNIESFFHIRWGIVLLCSCSQSYAVLANCIFVTGQALSCLCIGKLLHPEQTGRISASLAEMGIVRLDMIPMGLQMLGGAHTHHRSFFISSSSGRTSFSCSWLGL